MCMIRTSQGRCVWPAFSDASCSVCRKAVAPREGRSVGAFTAQARSSATLRQQGAFTLFRLGVTDRLSCLYLHLLPCSPSKTLSVQPVWQP